MKKKIQIFFLIFFCSLFSSFSHASPNIVFLDIEYAVNNSNIGKKLLSDLQKIQNEEVSKLKILEDDLKKKDSEINKVKNIISKEELENKIKLLKKEINVYNIKKDEIEIKFNNNKSKRQDDLIKQINPLIIKYMSDNSIDLIISKQIVYLGKTELDITNDILKLINESFK
tara:strand:- start:426 stop:938 length:513 start_codon:yes stop_codon:yes gene_type:complete